MNRINVIIRGAGVLVVAGVLATGAYVVVEGGEYTANLYLAPSAANNCTGGRSATKINYSTAVTQNRVCTTWLQACIAATGGDEIGVRAGTYAEETPAAAATYLEDDCSDGAGNDVDPTAQAPDTSPAAVISNWATFECAEGQTRDSVIMDVKFFAPHDNNHAYIVGSCFLFGTIEYGIGSDTGLTTQNAIFDGVHIQGFQINGARNAWITNFEFGPVVACGQDGGPELEEFECDASGSVIGFFEHRWANRGNGSSDLQTQGRVNPNNNTHSENVLIENGWWHDSNSKSASSPDWHSGCGFVLDNESAATDNVIYRNILCERVVEKGFFMSDASGVTIENWQAGCPSDYLDNVGETNYGVEVCGQRTFSLNCAVNPCDNLLVRYNSFVTVMDFIDNTSVGVNVRAVGNLTNTYICPTDMAR